MKLNESQCVAAPRVATETIADALTILSAGRIKSIDLEAAERLRELDRQNVALLDVLEELTRQHCYTGTALRDYNGQVAGSLVTDSGALTTDSDALRRLADAGRFRIVAEFGRMVVGYWPENDPEKKEARP